jgi:hypothetical protein
MQPLRNVDALQRAIPCTRTAPSSKMRWEIPSEERCDWIIRQMPIKVGKSSETRRSEKNPLFRRPILQQILPQGNQSATRIPAVLVMLSTVSSPCREDRTCDANRRRFTHRKSALFKPMAMTKQTNRANLSRHGCLSHAIGTGWQSPATWRNRIPRHNTNIDL